MHRSVVIDSKINDCWIVLDGSRIQAELKMPFNLELKASLLGTHVPLTFSITHQKHCVYWPFVKPRSMYPGEILKESENVQLSPLLNYVVYRPPSVLMNAGINPLDLIELCFIMLTCKGRIQYCRYVYKSVYIFIHVSGSKWAGKLNNKSKWSTSCNYSCVIDVSRQEVKIFWNTPAKWIYESSFIYAF